MNNEVSAGSVPPWRPAAALAASGFALWLVSSRPQEAWALATGALCAVACAALAWPRSASAAAHEAAEGGTGARLMVSQVVPVWRRHLEASKAEAEKGVGGLLQAFSSISDGLARAAEQADTNNPRLSAGASEEALEEHAGAIDTLLEPMKAMRDERDRMLHTLIDGSVQLAELTALAKSVHEVSRHTHLLAFNAAIEANRAGHGGSGFTVLAQEVRSLAGRSAAASERINTLVHQMSEQVDGLRRSAELQRTGDDELDMVARQRARAVASALVTRMAGALRGSRELRDSAERIREQLDQVFLNFQFQDRLTQMLDVVGHDMNRFAEWVAANDQASSADAAKWLADLEGNYTMEEQRTHHHGNVKIERSANVEFF